MKPTNDIETLKKEYDEKVQELVDWNYGTINKQYDREETCLLLEDDTRVDLAKLWNWITTNSVPRGEAEKVKANKACVYCNGTNVIYDNDGIPWACRYCISIIHHPDVSYLKEQS
jgi:hypothetical protein